MSELTPGKKRFVKRHLTAERPTILIGKSGASEQMLKEIQKQLEKNKMVKIRILKTALASREVKQLSQEIAKKTESALVDIRGHTFMLYKRSKQKDLPEATKPDLT